MGQLWGLENLPWEGWQWGGPRGGIWPGSQSPGFPPAGQGPRLLSGEQLLKGVVPTPYARLAGVPSGTLWAKPPRTCFLRSSNILLFPFI